MRGVGKRFAAAVAAACCLLTPAFAGYTAVPASTLVSNRDLHFKLSRERRGAETVTVLVHEAAGGNIVPVASITESSDGNDVRVRLLEAASRPDLKVATLEHLYVLLLRQEPVAKYSFGSRERLSQGALLAELVDARERTKPAVSWRMISMSRVASTSTNEDDVSVRVVNGAAPMKGVTVYFNRAPHSLCHAMTSEDGVAACRLVDQHPDGDEQEQHAPVVVTFPGDVRADRALVPTTFVVRDK